MATWTITFGECVENHAGMQKLGTTSSIGFTYDELVNLGHRAKNSGYDVRFYQLDTLLPLEYKSLLTKEDQENACLLLIKKGINMFHEPANIKPFVEEVKATKNLVDKQAIMRGKLVNKHARWNLCYADKHQDADIKNGKGTVLSFDEVPYLQNVRRYLPLILGDKAKDLYAELNYYYDIKKCGIGYHGDTERSRVIGIRIGDTMDLHYQWYASDGSKVKPVGSNFNIDIDHGDVYVMGQKAVGTDWKKRKIPTLRHAAGSGKYVHTI